MISELQNSTTVKQDQVFNIRVALHKLMGFLGGEAVCMCDARMIIQNESNLTAIYITAK